MLAVLVGLPTLAGAQTSEWREAPIIEPHQILPVAPAPVPPPTAETVLRTYIDGCVQHEGRPTAVVDWALTQGFEPLDPLRADPAQLLGGLPGTALAAPGSGSQLVLAITDDGRCVLWAERMSGPALRQALQSMVGTLGGQGHRLQLVTARNVQAGGTWRHQALWRYRRIGGSQDFGIGSATTLVDGPGSQLLHFGPMEAPAPPDPDGMPRR